jgi:hypothetical protein
LIEAYSRFANLRLAERSSELPLLDYSRFKFTQPCKFGIRWFFRQAAEDCAREIANTIHDLRRFIGDASVWIEVLKRYPDDERLIILVEFLDAPFAHAMSRPYAIKNRFVYSLSMLGTFYQARRMTSPPIKDYRRCTYTTMGSLVGGWMGFDAFASALKRLNEATFEDYTGEYRNSDHHRIPARLGIGQVPGHRVFTGADGRVSFSSEVLNPLQIVDVLPHLSGQYLAATSCMELFWALVEERESHW